MHRYWHDVFPEDFPHSGTACTSSKEPLMRFAIKTLDDMLADVLRWTALNPDLVVIFASSMGQDAIHRDYHEGVELVVEDLTLLMSNAGIARYDYHPLLAMAPQIAVEVQDADKRALVRKVLEEAYCGAGVSFIRVQEIGASLSITVGTPTLEDMATGTFFINCKNLPWEAAGIRRQNVEPGTGYHIPEGSLAVYSEKTQHQTLCRTRARVNSDRMKEWMLNISRDGIDQISPPAAV